LLCGARPHSNDDADLVYRLSGGNPAAAGILLDGLAVDERAATCVDAPVQAAAERILARLLGRLPADAREILATWAAARNRADAIALTRSDSTERLSLMFEPDVWGSGQLVETTGMRPELRWPLLRRLAGADKAGYRDWDDTFGFLRELHAPRSQSGLYYSLALGDLPNVVDALYAGLFTMNMADWLLFLRSATAAPSRSRPIGRPLDVVANLTADVDGCEQAVSDVARLTAGLWISADPLFGGGDRDLQLMVASCFDRIAALSAASDIAPLLAAAAAARSRAAEMALTSSRGWSES
jgi:hypothetical protein